MNRWRTFFEAGMRVCVPVLKAFVAAVVVLLFCFAVHVCKMRWFP